MLPLHESEVHVPPPLEPDEALRYVEAHKTLA